MPDDSKQSEELPSSEEVSYYLDSLDMIFQDTGKFTRVLGDMIGAGQELSHLYEDGALAPLEALKAAVDKARPEFQKLALEIRENQLERENGQTEE